MYTTELCNLLRESDYLIWYCSALDDLKTCTKKRSCGYITELQGLSFVTKVVDNDTNEIIWQQSTTSPIESTYVIEKNAQDIISSYSAGVVELVQGQINTEIWKYQIITGIDIPEFDSWPKQVLKNNELSNSEVKYKAIQYVCPNKSRLSFTKEDLLQIYEAAKLIDYEKVRKLVDADKKEIKKWIWKYTGDEYTSCIHFRELVDTLDNKCETLS